MRPPSMVRKRGTFLALGTTLGERSSSKRSTYTENDSSSGRYSPIWPRVAIPPDDGGGAAGSSGTAGGSRSVIGS